MSNQEEKEKVRPIIKRKNIVYGQIEIFSETVLFIIIFISIIKAGKAQPIAKPRDSPI